MSAHAQQFFEVCTMYYISQLIPTESGLLRSPIIQILTWKGSAVSPAIVGCSEVGDANFFCITNSGCMYTGGLVYFFSLLKSKLKEGLVDEPLIPLSSGCFHSFCCEGYQFTTMLCWLNLQREYMWLTLVSKAEMVCQEVLNGNFKLISMQHMHMSACAVPRLSTLNPRLRSVWERE